MIRRALLLVLLPAIVFADCYEDLVLSHGPLWYYRLDETSGTAAADNSGNGNTGTYSGSYTQAVTGLLTGDTNTALDVTSGSSGRVCNSNATSLSAFTVVILMNADSVVSHQSMINRNDQRVQIGFNDAGGPIFNVYDPVLGKVTAGCGIGNLVAGTTYHLAGVATENGTIACYRNGSVGASTPAIGDFSELGTAEWCVGKGVDTHNNFDGVLDEPFVVASALTEPQIDALADCALNGPPASSMGRRIMQSRRPALRPWSPVEWFLREAA